MEKVHIAFEINKQIKERFVAAEAFIQGASISLIVSSDAFQREINSIPNSVVTSPGLIDCLCSSNAVTGKNDLATDRIRDCHIVSNDLLIHLGDYMLIVSPIEITVGDASPYTF